MGLLLMFYFAPQILQANAITTTISEPISPCPLIFQYRSDGATWFGIVKINPEVPIRVANLMVQLSVPLNLPSEFPKGSIQVIGSKSLAVRYLSRGKAIAYKLDFPPLPHFIPSIVTIKFNNKIICQDLRPISSIATLIQIEHSLSKTITVDKTIKPTSTTPTLISFGNRGNFETFVDDLHNNSEDSNEAEAILNTDILIFNMSNNPLNCGFSDVDVTRAYEPIKGDWPWLTAIYQKKVVSLDFICAGNLLSPRLVLTAAHCVFIKGELTNSSDLLLNIGSYDLNDWLDTDVILKSVKRIEIPIELTSLNVMHNDIAALVLDDYVIFTDFVKPVCLWTSKSDHIDIFGKTGTVIGWGNDGSNEMAASLPKSINVPIVSNQECVRSNKLFASMISNKTICAGSKDGTGPCNRDSGGGLYMKVEGLWTLRGIVSNSVRSSIKSKVACDLTEYVVYTDVAKYTHWIYSLT